jgi:hypothetical protein
MSEHGSEPSDDGPMSVPDEDLPDDVRPGDDNPLAQPAGDEVPDDILKDTSQKRPLEDLDDDTEHSTEASTGDDTDR